MYRKSGIKKFMFVCLMIVITNEMTSAQIIQNNTFWKDISGNPIYSQGGGTIKVGDTWYWYGAKYNGAITYYNNPTSKNGDTGFLGVTCYSSKDLVNWKYEGIVFTGSFGWFGRLGVVYNSNTKKYVLIAQESMNRVLFATSSTPTGKFTQEKIQVPPGVANEGTGDQTVFQDDDGKAYIICSSKSGRSNLYVIPLRESDFLNCEQAVRVFKGAGREGNCMFKYRGRYYFCSSDLHGWNSSHCYYISATNILGPYSSEGIMVNSGLDFCHVTQTGFFITVNGTEDTTVIFCGDRWSDFAGNGIGYNQWCPVTFNGTTPVFNSLSQWSLDAVKGTWRVGPGNNYILNPGFEADRVLQTSLAGWSGTKNASGSRYSGRFCLHQTESGTASQNISSIPIGTYELKAWVQSSGGQSTCKIFISDFGGSEMSYSINKAISKWTEISIPNIQITSGKCRVGVTSVNNGNNWCKVDDFSLIRVGTGTLYGINAIATPGGIIEQNPAGDSLAKGTKVTFRAVPLDGWAFKGWSGDHTGTDPSYTITSLSSNVSLNASFRFTSADSTLYEGENTKMFNSIAESTNSGFSGTGYANFNNGTGSSVEFAVCVSSDGEKNVVITFANGSSAVRPVSVSVNGSVIINSLSFNPTGVWTTWNTKEISVNLNKGINTIKFTSLTSDGGPNIDNIEFKRAVSVRSAPMSNKPVITFDPAGFIIQTYCPGKEVQIQMHTIDGKTVLNRKLNPGSGSRQFRLPIHMIDNGVYILRVKAGNVARVKTVHVLK